MKDVRQCPGVTCDPDVLEGYKEDASGLVGAPSGVVRARDSRDVVEAMNWARGNHVALTPVGARTSTTGSAAPIHGGLVVSLERLQTIERIASDVVRVGAGFNVGALKKSLGEEGWLYPPDPTSENDCTLGGTIATNASGPRSLKYGATRPYLRALEVVLPNGVLREYRRRDLEKDTTGYGMLADPLQWFVGAEGTLGMVTAAELQLVPLPEQILSFFVYFPTLEMALDAVLWLRGNFSRKERPDGPWKTVSPRCIELFDDEALKIIRGKASGFGVTIPEEAGALLFLEQELRTEDEESCMEAWFEILMAITPMAESVTVAENRARQRNLRDLRHHVPATLNEEARSYREEGGRKISTDWAVPLDRLHEAVEEATQICASTQIAHRIRYGHIGNGHPHFNLIARNASELERASAAAKEMAKMAVRYGGTPAAEHGLGKVKSSFLEIVHPPEVIQAMRAMKHQIDPQGLLAPGNLFPL